MSSSTDDMTQKRRTERAVEAAVEREVVRLWVDVSLSTASYNPKNFTTSRNGSATDELERGVLSFDVDAAV